MAKIIGNPTTTPMTFPDLSSKLDYKVGYEIEIDNYKDDGQLYFIKDYSPDTVGDLFEFEPYYLLVLGKYGVITSGKTHTQYKYAIDGMYKRHYTVTKIQTGVNVETGRPIIETIEEWLDWEKVVFESNIKPLIDTLTLTDDGIICQTSYNTLKAAFESGRNVLIRFPEVGFGLGDTLVPLTENGDVLRFGLIKNDIACELTCNSNNEWNYSSTRLATFEDMVGITDNKADKVDVTYEYDTTYSFGFDKNYNKEIRMLVQATNISFVFGNNEYFYGYASALSFDSGATPTAIDYSSTGIVNWVGTDCAITDGKSIFRPSANTHYDIVFYYNGSQFIGLVNGYVPASINVPVPEDGNVVSE